MGIENDSVADDLMKAMNELDGVEELNDPADLPEGEEKPAEIDDNQEPVKNEKIEPAPNSWGKSVKEKWADLPPEVRAEIIKREEDVHKMATNQDQDRLFGRDMNQLLTPYAPAIQEAGGTPMGVIQNALNSMYWLYKGDEKQKQDIVRDIISTYNINVEGLLEGIEYTDPTIRSLQDEIRALKSQANNVDIDKMLTDKLNRAKIDSEIEAFASDPSNQHFEKVRPAMAALLSSGVAKTLKEAYDAACRADPAIHSTLEVAKAVKQQAQRKQDIAAKKRAASSVVGSPAISNPPAKTNENTNVFDDVRAAFNTLSNEL